MTQTIRAHYDGRVLVPDEPLDLPAGESVNLTISLSVHKLEGAGDPPKQTMEEWLDQLAELGRGLAPISDEALRRENIYDERP